MNKIKILAFLGCLMWANFSIAQSTESLLDQGYEKYLNEDYSSAIALYDEAALLDSSNAEIYYLRGVAKSHHGEKRAAMTDLEQATRLAPDYAEAYYEMGYLYLSDQNAELAIEAFNKTLTINPDFAEAYVSRGTAYCMMEIPGKAKKDWAKAKDLGIGYSEYMACD